MKSFVYGLAFPRGKIMVGDDDGVVYDAVEVVLNEDKYDPKIVSYAKATLLSPAGLAEVESQPIQ